MLVGGWRGEKGRKIWDDYNGTINKIKIKKNFSITTDFNIILVSSVQQ